MGVNISNEKLLIFYKNGDIKAREQLILINEGIINKLAYKYSHGRYEFEDLKQEGYIALLEAIDSYSFDYESSFITYAYKFIKTSIFNYMRNNSIIKAPHLNEKLIKFKKDWEAITQQLGYTPTIKELSDISGMTVKEIERLMILSQSIASLDECIAGEYENITLKDSIESEVESPEDIAVANDTSSIVRNVINSKLLGIEKNIIKGRYGFNGDIESVKALCERLRITYKELYRAEKKALRKLRRSSEIIKLRLDEQTFFIRKGHNPVLSAVIWREEKEQEIMDQEENCFELFEDYDEQKLQEAMHKLHDAKINDLKGWIILKCRVMGISKATIINGLNISQDKYDATEQEAIEFIKSII